MTPANALRGGYRGSDDHIPTKRTPIREKTLASGGRGGKECGERA